MKLNILTHKCKRLEKVLKNSGLVYSKHIQKPKINPFNPNKISKMVIFRILKNSCSWIFKFLNYDRTPKPSILRLNQKELKKVFDGIMLGDGVWNGSELTVQNPNILNFFRILCVLLGYRTLQFFSALENKQRTYVTYKNTCNIIISKHLKKIKYKGTIWCPHTKNGTFIAKRKGKIFITGNSFAAHFLMQGGDISDLKEFLGHKSIQSTMRYAGLKT
ncbi:hypothetical protein LCGC14_2570700, partial [marine sediment metagenome]